MNNTSIAPAKLIGNDTVIESQGTTTNWRISGFDIGMVVILITSVIGETFLLEKFRRWQKKLNFIDILTVYLAAMELVLVLSSIPEMLVFEAYGSFKFGDIGCKIVHPLSTFAITAVVFTLLAIAWERRNAINCKTVLVYSKKKVIVVLALINTLSFIVVIPYSVNLKYTEDPLTGNQYCEEVWSMGHRKIYTLILFLLQYGIPAPAMVYFYYNSWKQILKSAMVLRKFSSPLPTQYSITNDSSSTSSDSIAYSRTRMFSLKQKSTRATTTVNNNIDDDDSSGSDVKRPLQRSHTGKSCQHTVILSRHSQCKKLTKTFTMIVIVFLVFQLPNQLLWLYIDFFKQGTIHFNSDVLNGSYMLTFANCVLNPWIYGVWRRQSKKKVITCAV